MNLNPTSAPSFPQKQTARERLLDQSARLFHEQGLNVTLAEIAEAAETRLETAIKHFRDIDGLLAAYLSELMNASKVTWKKAGLERAADGDTAAKVARADEILRRWAKLMEAQCRNPVSPQKELARLALQLRRFRYRHSPLALFMEEYLSREREIVFDLCSIGVYEDYQVLADKILLLTSGALHEADRYYGSGRHLSKFINELLDAHKIPQEATDDFRQGSGDRHPDVSSDR